MFRFDQIFVNSMDRLVWLIVMIVSLNILINSGVHAAGDTDQEPSTSGDPLTITKQVEFIANLGNNDQKQQQTNGRSSILDNIFNIPIATLKAVNELVQSIAGNLQAAGSGTYFQKSLKTVHIQEQPQPILTASSVNNSPSKSDM